MTIRERLVLTTPEEAKELLKPVLREWGNYFSYNTSAKILYEIWNYAQNRPMYMHCNQHKRPRKWSYRGIRKKQLFLMEQVPPTILSKRHNTMS